MALAFKRFNCSITTHGRTKKNKKTNHFRSEATTISAGSTNASDLTGLFSALTQGAVSSRTFSEEYAETAASYLVDTDVHEVAVIKVRLVQTVTSKSEWGEIIIPAPVKAMFMANTGDGADKVNPAYAPLQSFLASFYGTNRKFSLSDGQEIQNPATAGNVEGYRDWR